MFLQAKAVSEAPRLLQLLHHPLQNINLQIHQEGRELAILQSQSLIQAVKRD
jgi:hypothetical protein